MNISEIFAKHNAAEYLKFDRVNPKLAIRRDVHAFILLDNLLSAEGGDIVSCAEHDEIWLNIDTAALAKVVTEAQIIELLRCGVSYDDNVESLRMNV